MYIYIYICFSSLQTARRSSYVLPFRPTLAKAFLYTYEKEWLDNCPSHFKPIVYRRYVDDIFVLFSSKKHLQAFVYYMNKQHRCIKFTSETEQNNTFSFLDINITRQNN